MRTLVPVLLVLFGATTPVRSEDNKVIVVYSQSAVDEVHFSVYELSGLTAVSKVAMDCECMNARLENSSDGQMVRFELNWKDRTMIGAKIAFVPVEAGELPKPKTVWFLKSASKKAVDGERSFVAALPP